MVYWESPRAGQPPVSGLASHEDVGSPSSGGVKPLVLPLSAHVKLKRSKCGDTNATLSTTVHIAVEDLGVRLSNSQLSSLVLATAQFTDGIGRIEADAARCDRPGVAAAAAAAATVVGLDGVHVRLGAGGRAHHYFHVRNSRRLLKAVPFMMPRSCTTHPSMPRPPRHHYAACVLVRTATTGTTESSGGDQNSGCSRA